MKPAVWVGGRVHGCSGKARFVRVQSWSNTLTDQIKAVVPFQRAPFYLGVALLDAFLRAGLAFLRSA